MSMYYRVVPRGLLVAFRRIVDITRSTHESRWNLEGELPVIYRQRFQYARIRDFSLSSKRDTLHVTRYFLPRGGLMKLNVRSGYKA